MKPEHLRNEIRIHFPNAEIGRAFLPSKTSILKNNMASPLKIRVLQKAAAAMKSTKANTSYWNNTGANVLNSED
jgi:hypothetical protein